MRIKGYCDYTRYCKIDRIIIDLDTNKLSTQTFGCLIDIVLVSETFNVSNKRE